MAGPAVMSSGQRFFSLLEPQSIDRVTTRAPISQADAADGDRPFGADHPFFAV